MGRPRSSGYGSHHPFAVRGEGEMSPSLLSIMRAPRRLSWRIKSALLERRMAAVEADIRVLLASAAMSRRRHDVLSTRLGQLVGLRWRGRMAVIRKKRV